MIPKSLPCIRRHELRLGFSRQEKGSSGKRNTGSCLTEDSQNLFFCAAVEDGATASSRSSTSKNEASRANRPVLLRRRGRRRYRFFAFFDVKKRGFACKPSRYAFAGRPKKRSSPAPRTGFGRDQLNMFVKPATIFKGNS
jgi:hypothetical protein